MKIIQTFWTAGQDPLKHSFGWTHPEYNLMSWALSKIKTYSLQPDPFLHIDGDIYVLNRIPEVIAESQLVAQNREIGTGYYRQMMDKIIHVVYE